MNSIDDFKNIKRKFKKNLISITNELEQLEEIDDLDKLTTKVNKAKSLRIESEDLFK